MVRLLRRSPLLLYSSCHLAGRWSWPWTREAPHVGSVFPVKLHVAGSLKSRSVQASEMTCLPCPELASSSVLHIGVDTARSSGSAVDFTQHSNFHRLTMLSDLPFPTNRLISFHLPSPIVLYASNSALSSSVPHLPLPLPGFRTSCHLSRHCSLLRVGTNSQTSTHDRPKTATARRSCSSSSSDHEPRLCEGSRLRV